MTKKQGNGKKAGAVQTSALNGRDYIAVVRFADERDRTLVVAGESCEKLPTSELPALLEAKLIAPAAAAAVKE